jgi:hypothetical protein
MKELGWERPGISDGECLWDLHMLLGLFASVSLCFHHSVNTLACLTDCGAVLVRVSITVRFVKRMIRGRNDSLERR